MARKKVTVESDQYSKLDEYCIWLNEYFESLKRAGFHESVAMYLITERDSFPDWVHGKSATEIVNLIQEEDGEDS